MSGSNATFDTRAEVNPDTDPAERSTCRSSAASLGEQLEPCHFFYIGVRVLEEGLPKGSPFKEALFLPKAVSGKCCLLFLEPVRRPKVRALLRYHDFSRWFLPLKGEEKFDMEPPQRCSKCAHILCKYRRNMLMRGRRTCVLKSG